MKSSGLDEREGETKLVKVNLIKSYVSEVGARWGLLPK